MQMAMNRFSVWSSLGDPDLSQGLQQQSGCGAPTVGATFHEGLYSMAGSPARKIEAQLLTTPALALRLAKKIAGANLQRLG